MLKRLAGSEFCSDAHRREYQHEYSQLALGRLMQSRPAEPHLESEKAPLHPTAPALATDPSPAAAVRGRPALANPPPAAVSGTPVLAEAGAVPHWSEMARPAPNESVVSTTQNGIAKSLLPAAIREEKSASQPPMAKAAAVLKPAPAELQFALGAAPEFEHAFASLIPDRPRCEANIVPLELAQGQAIHWERSVEMSDSIAHPVERHIDLREVSRPAPRIALDLRIVPPESLATEDQSLAIPVTPAAAPDEASLWIGSHREVAGSLVSLSAFADDQFSKSDFEAPPFDGGSASEVSPPADGPALEASPLDEGSVLEAGPPLDSSEVDVVSELLPPEPQPSTDEREPPPETMERSSVELQTAAAAPAVQVPDPELDPLPVNAPGIAPGRARPIPVFGSVATAVGTVQIPQPNGLPLRPQMVLRTPAPTVEGKPRKSGLLGLRETPSATPSPQSKISAPSLEPNLGLPVLRMQTPGGVSWIRKIVAGLAGAAVLGTAIFVFVGKQSDAGSKLPSPALADSPLGGQWIANFAPDARRQRRVSLLRSTVNLSDYRLDFESSIQVKALGWVYRAGDAKNFYVSKIELQKPGQVPVYVLVHYAVINGVDQPRVEAPLHVTMPLGGRYKIRFDAVGNRFTTWVQGQQVEQWTDSRLSRGGTGLYGEGVEQSILHGDFTVTPLLKQK
ncbi:MAG: hypothetical protein ABI833_00990 [Acidobacteriota bacterium]